MTQSQSQLLPPRTHLHLSRPIAHQPVTLPPTLVAHGRPRAKHSTFKMSAPPDSPSQADTAPQSPMSPQSDVAPSSPARIDGPSFVSRAGDDTDAAEDPVEKTSRREKKKDKEGGGAHVGKIRHLKKDDGEPLWRTDIQHDFLKAVFDDEKPVFTNSYDPSLPKQNFADLYIDTMSRSSKTSKVLRDKLMSDREAAKGMAMVCLLVNMGRMNTTLNCKPSILTSIGLS